MNEWSAPKSHWVFGAFVALYFDTLFCVNRHHRDARIRSQLLWRQSFKTRMFIAVLGHPEVQVVHVRDVVQDATRFDNVGVIVHE